MELLIPLGLLLALTPLFVTLMRANELFYLRLRDGRLMMKRGRIPRGLFDDVEDILKRGGVENIDVRGVVEDRGARIYLFGVQPRGGVKQQLRNAISLWPLAKIRHAPKWKS